MQAEPRTPQDAEPELIQDFIEESREAFEEIESLWLKIETGKADQADFGELIRRLHLIGSVLRIGGYAPVAEFGDRIVAILDRVQTGRLPFGELINDVVLFAIEQLESLTEALMASQLVDYAVIGEKSDYLRRILECEPDDVDMAAGDALQALTNKRLGVPVSSRDDQLCAEPPHNGVALVVDNAAPSSAKTAGDLAFFRDLMDKIERCHPELRGRGERILNIAAAMNDAAGLPVDPTQLEAAVYVHDIGMAFLPNEPLRRMDRLSSEERLLLREHPLTSAELLHRVGGWDEAARIVLQHHEHQDGRGYPHGDLGDAICAGAKILAIADTIYAMTHKQSYRAFGRPLLRAVAEINNCAGSQFAKEWVQIFNQVVRETRGRLLFDA